MQEVDAGDASAVAGRVCMSASQVTCLLTKGPMSASRDKLPTPCEHLNQLIMGRRQTHH